MSSKVDPQIEVLQKMLEEQNQQAERLGRENQQLKLKVAGLEKRLADAEAKFPHSQKTTSEEVIEVIDSDDETKPDPSMAQPKVENGLSENKPIVPILSKKPIYVDLVDDDSGDEAVDSKSGAVASKLQEETVPVLNTPTRKPVPRTTRRTQERKSKRSPSPRESQTHTPLSVADIPARPVEVPRESMSPLSRLLSPDASRDSSMDVDESAQLVVKREPRDEARSTRQAGYFLCCASTARLAYRASSSKPRNRGRRKTESNIIPKAEVKEEVVDAIFEREVNGSRSTNLGHLVMTQLGIIKSEEGEVGPDYEVPEEYTKMLFSRTEFSKAIGGATRGTRHNWFAPEGRSRKRNTANNSDPYATFTKDYDTSLPLYPGARGYAIGCTLDQAWTKPDPIAIMVKQSPSHWRVMGNYDTQETAMIPLEAIARLPEQVMATWCNGIARKNWGKEAIQRANKELPPHRHVKQEFASIRAALLDGRMELRFTVLKCVGFPYQWYDVLKQNQERGPARTESKPKVEDDEAQTRLSRTSNVKGKKRQAAEPLAGRQKRRRRDSDVDEDEDASERDDDSDGEYEPRSQK
ncbi:hypothetical protein HMN09_00545500 [Mycena chlorophos]|uniref:DUF6697 domain-containing protein n=1 Tax=Mycena chlorophos TaxID=658473 RepID=A0A8H6WDJ0_MYCCL|nr:hypothetical protein HMN09_00545500 [Mycena chlorophos]